MATQTWVNSSADVPNADHADYANSAGDADSIDGYDVQKDGSDSSGVINFKTD